MVDFNALLAQKYSILQQDSDARMAAAKSEAQLNAARAGAITSMTPLDAEQKRIQNLAMPGGLAAETALKQAGANQTTMQTSLAPGLAQSTIDLQGTQAADNRSRVDVNRSQATVNNAAARSQLSGISPWVTTPQRERGVEDTYGNKPAPPAPVTTPGWSIPFFAHGTEMVQGPGDGTVDTVPAVLAHGEAVLNKGANDMMPRGLVDTLNKIGLARMGMPGGAGQKGKAPGYAEGTSNVGGIVGALSKVNDALSDAPAAPAASRSPAPSSAPMTGGIDLKQMHYKPNPEPLAAPTRPANNGLLMMDNTGAPKGYAKGTAKVSGPSKKASAPLMTPAMMEMLMQMQGGGASQGGGGILTAPSAAQTLGMP